MSCELSETTLAAAALEALLGSELPLGLAVLDRNLRFVRINAILAAGNGLSIEAHLGRSVREVLPAAADEVEPLLQRVLDTGEPQAQLRIEVEVPSLPGRKSEWEASYRAIRGADGRPIGILAHAVNHSLERHNARLKQERDLLRRVWDNAFVMIGLLSPEGAIQEANQAGLGTAALPISAVRDVPAWDTYWFGHDPALRDWVRQAVARAAAGETLRRDMVLRTAGDGRMAVDYMLAPMRDAEGRVTHLVASAVDISKRVAAQRALHDSEERYRRMFEGSLLGKSLVDPHNGRALLVNESLARMFGHPVAALTGQPLQWLLPERLREAQVAWVREAARGTSGPPAPREMLGLRRDGSEFPIEVTLNPVSGEPDSALLLTVRDVTERRAAQQQIESALREKTVLLNEIHHRVKNNLQVIASLLSLQGRNAEPAVQAALRDSQSRVRSMALLHQLLYERTDFSALELGPYLRRLGMLLRDTYLGSGTAVRLEVAAQDDGLRIELQRAVPCGLLVTELVTNAIKHAFPAGAPGTVAVRVTPQADGQVSVDVLDDGIGMPEPAARRRGLGFQLLPLLAEQCGAQLQELDTAAVGTHLRLLMKLEVVPHHAGLPA